MNWHLLAQHCSLNSKATSRCLLQCPAPVQSSLSSRSEATSLSEANKSLELLHFLSRPTSLNKLRDSPRELLRIHALRSCIISDDAGRIRLLAFFHPFLVHRLFLIRRVAPAIRTQSETFCHCAYLRVQPPGFPSQPSRVGQRLVSIIGLSPRPLVDGERLFTLRFRNPSSDLRVWYSGSSALPTHVSLKIILSFPTTPGRSFVGRKNLCACEGPLDRLKLCFVKSSCLTGSPLF